jgi:Glycosyltransferase family 87
VYALAALLLRSRLIPDPRLVRSNDFTGNLMSPDHPLAYAMLGVWERFDTLWYLHIAQTGYDRQAAIVFYPLYPALIRIVSQVLHPPLAAALAISTLAAFAFAWGLQELLRLDLPDRTAARALLLLAVWPGSFILFAGYADSLVMALSVWSVYCARTERWRLAGVLGLFAGSAKAMGVVVAAPLAWLAWRKDRRRLWTAALPLAGPAAFSLWIRTAGYGSSTAAYAAHWHTRVAWPWSTLAASVRAFFATPPNLILRLNLIFLVLACGLMLVRRLRMEYRLYALASLALFLTKSTDPLLQSTVRYVLAVFPLFLALAMVLERRRVGLIAFCAFFAFLNAVLLFGFWRWSLLV